MIRLFCDSFTFRSFYKNNDEHMIAYASSPQKPLYLEGCNKYVKSERKNAWDDDGQIKIIFLPDLNERENMNSIENVTDFRSHVRYRYRYKHLKRVLHMGQSTLYFTVTKIVSIRVNIYHHCRH